MNVETILFYFLVYGGIAYNVISLIRGKIRLGYFGPVYRSTDPKNFWKMYIIQSIVLIIVIILIHIYGVGIFIFE
jgi:heme O synthase-like polyprenyltransferase